MPYQNREQFYCICRLLPNQYLTFFNVYLSYYLFLIVMASTSTSPSFEDHTSGTDLNDIPTEEEE